MIHIVWGITRVGQFPNPMHIRDQLLHQLAKAKEAVQQAQRLLVKHSITPNNIVDTPTLAKRLAALNDFIDTTRGWADAVHRKPTQLGRDAPIDCYAFNVEATADGIIYYWFDLHCVAHRAMFSPVNTDRRPNFNVHPMPGRMRIRWDAENRRYEWGDTFCFPRT